MADVTTQANLERAEDYETAIEACLTEVRDLLLKMKNDQAEIDRLKLASAELRADTQRLIAETRSVLTQLQV